MIFTFGREYGISEVGKGAVSCSPNFQIPRNLKLDTRTETRARPNSSLENPQIFFEDRVENYWRQLIANIRETMQCERTSKRFLSFSIVQKFSALVKKKLHRFYYITLLFPLYTRRDFCHRNAFYARPSLMPMYQRFHSFVHSSLKSSSHRSIRGIRPFILNIV